MRPEDTTVIFREDLAATAREYDDVKAAARFIARRAAPVFRTAGCDGEYPIMRRANFKKRTDTKRTSQGAYNRIIGQFGRGTFACEEHGLEYPIDDRKRKKYASLFDAEAAATKILRFQLLMDHEYRVATLYSGSGLTNHNVSTAWSDTTNAVPITDIDAGLDAIQDNCGAGRSEMSIIIPRADFRELIRTDQINDKLQYTYPGVQPANLQAEEVAAMLAVKQVLVAESVYDSKEEGIAESNTQFWSSGVLYVVLLCGEDEPLEEPSAARTILWTGDAPELPVVESYREEKVRSDIVRSRDDTDEVMIGATDLFAYKLTNT